MARGDSVSSDLARLILRLVLGALILLHGIYKLRHGVDFIGGMLAHAGLPRFIAYGVYIGEVLAPVLLIAGIWTRAGAFIIVFNMVVAVALAHRTQLTGLNETGGWTMELQAMYLFTALAVLLLGAGRYSVGGSAGRFN